MQFRNLTTSRPS